jgi:predicted AlkP superfamily phosphohydrolase/phosphomutase
LEKTIWQLLGEVDLRSIIMDVPFTYPLRPLNGWMITGYGTPRKEETTFTYPPNLSDLLPKELRPEVRVALPSHNFDRSPEFIQEWGEIMVGRKKLFHHLITNQDWDLFMAVFSITDNMAHVFWTFVDPNHPNYNRSGARQYREAFFEAYEMCDMLLGEMMDMAGAETTTFVISDHGFGSVRPRQYVFQRLMEGGFLHAKSPHGFSIFGDRLMKIALNTYKNFPILREWVKDLRPEGRRKIKQRLRQGGLLPSGESIDYSRSKIIPTNFGLRMWINDRERFSQGNIQPTDIDLILDEVSAYLEADVDPVNGLPIISNTYRGKEIYHGPYSHKGPDLIIEYNNFFCLDEESNLTNPFTEGGHTQKGIFLVSGPEIGAGRIDGMSLIDLAPTILYLFNQPIPPDMDGHVLGEIFKIEHICSHPINYGNRPAQYAPGERPEAISGAMTSEEETDLHEQLRQLGYI